MKLNYVRDNDLLTLIFIQFLPTLEESMYPSKYLPSHFELDCHYGFWVIKAKNKTDYNNPLLWSSVD